MVSLERSEVDTQTEAYRPSEATVVRLMQHVSYLIFSDYIIAANYDYIHVAKMVMMGFRAVFMTMYIYDVYIDNIELSLG